MLAQLQRLANWQALSAAEIHAAFSEVVSIRKPADPNIPDSAWATGARGLRDFGAGPDGWGGMRAKLHELGYGDVADQMTNGLDFGDPNVQTMLDQLGLAAPAVFTPLRVTTMKAWGVCEQSCWWHAGGSGDVPSVEEIQQAIDQLRFDHRVTNAIALFRERMTEGGDAAAVMAQAWIEAA